MADMDDLRRHAERTGEIVNDLMSKQPDLNPITAHIIAGDLHSAEKAHAAVLDGSITAEKSLIWVGSYARWDYAIRLMREGLLPREAFFRDIAHLWSGSDPDDTNPEYLMLWLEARGLNNGRTITDGAPLPRPSAEWLTVWRGGANTSALWQGFAWSLKRDIAQKFANGADQRMPRHDGVVITGRVKRGSVIAYLTGRGESEVIVASPSVHHLVVAR